MKKLMIILMALIMLTGCGSGSADSTPSTAETTAETQEATTKGDNPYTTYEYGDFVLAYPKDWRIDTEDAEKLTFHPTENDLPVIVMMMSETDMAADGAHDYFVEHAVTEAASCEDLKYEFEAKDDRILYEASYYADNIPTYDSIQ